MMAEAREIERFEFDPKTATGVWEAVDGEFVRFTDHQAKLQEVERERDLLREKVALKMDDADAEMLRAESAQAEADLASLRAKLQKETDHCRTESEDGRLSGHIASTYGTVARRLTNILEQTGGNDGA